MEPEKSALLIILICMSLLSLFVSFILFWLFAAKKQKMGTYLGHNYNNEKRERIKLRYRIWSPLLRLSKYLGPTAIKYPIATSPENDKKLLVKAGNPMRLNLEQFYGMRLATFIICFFIGWFYFILGFSYSLLVFLFLPVLGFVLPNLWLRYVAKDRQEIISASMPDFLDTVSVSLRAGASLDGALKQVGEQMEGPLSDEINHLNREIALGVPREKAYENLLSRNDSRELEILVQSLIQGSELGVPVSKTFRIQAEDLRSMRGFKAKEKAAKASPKITLVTTMTIVPSVFLLIVGLLVLNFIYNPGAFGLDIFFN